MQILNMPGKNTKKDNNSFLLILIISFIIIISSFVIYRGKLLHFDRVQKYVDFMNRPKTQIAQLSEMNSSGITGEAILTEYENNLFVAIKLVDYTPNISLPAHIHYGTCEELGEIIYPLMDVDSGESVTEIDTNFKELKKLTPIAINIHKSSNQMGTSVSCAQLK